MVRPLIASRKTIQPGDEEVRYRGSAGALDADLLLQVMRDLVVVKPVLGWLPSGGVLRDQEKTCAWAKWYCDYLHRYFRDSHHDNCRHVLLLVTERTGKILNILSRLEPITGEGSISFRTFVTRTSEDEYACFEY